LCGQYCFPRNGKVGGDELGGEQVDVNVLWSDEVTFEVGKDSRIWVARKHNEELLLKNLNLLKVEMFR